MAPSSASRILSRAQSSSVRRVIDNEFAPYISQTDPEFESYANVSDWAKERWTKIFEEDYLFRTSEVNANKGRYEQVRGPFIDCAFHSTYIEF